MASLDIKINVSEEEIVDKIIKIKRDSLVKRRNECNNIYSRAITEHENQCSYCVKDDKPVWDAYKEMLMLNDILSDTKNKEYLYIHNGHILYPDEFLKYIM